MKQKNILFVVASHGDEPIGVDVVRRIRRNYKNFDQKADIIVGNPLAYKRGVRFIDCDLNRSAPGNVLSAKYEEKRAFDLIRHSQKYRYTIDIHGSSKDNGIFTIVTNPTEANLRLSSMLPIQRIVVLPSIIPDLVDPISKYFRCGVEIENGPKDADESYRQLEKSLIGFLDKSFENKGDYREILKNREVYEVYGVLDKMPEGMVLREFQKVSLGGEKFYAIFVGSYEYCACLKMRRKTFGIDGG